MGVAKSISGDTFVTGSKINAPTTHVQTLSSQMSPKMASRAENDRVFIGKRLRQIQIWRQVLNRK